MNYKPSDYTDVGQAAMLAQHYGNRLRYTGATGYLHYNGRYWQACDLTAQQYVHELTGRQLAEATEALQKASEALHASGAAEILINTSRSRARQLMSDEQKQIYDEYVQAQQYRAYVLLRRDTKRITATLQEARPMLAINQRCLDNNPYLLCTPAATYDLRRGLKGRRAHSPRDYITKTTAVSPGSKGADLWQAFLEEIFCNDRELIDYVQLVCGLAAIGKVLVEAIIISYGTGKNGKSTYWNTIARVLGTYSGTISADVLTNQCNRNTKPEIAELQGKRLILASELPQNTQINDATIKHLCSTDQIHAEKKYKDPFEFNPSHTLILCTNHLPAVKATDHGTWRRLIVIPFRATIRASGDVKNYSDYLYTHAGASILAWIIEGARRVIELDYTIAPPQCVRQAIQSYHAQNNWFDHFLSQCCEVAPEYRCSSPALYQAYRNYCRDTNRRVYSTNDFYMVLERAGYRRITIDRKRYIVGLRLTDDASPHPQPAE